MRKRRKKEGRGKGKETDLQVTEDRGKGKETDLQVTEGDKEKAGDLLGQLWLYS